MPRDVPSVDLASEPEGIITNEALLKTPNKKTEMEKERRFKAFVEELKKVFNAPGRWVDRRTLLIAYPNINYLYHLGKDGGVAFKKEPISSQIIMRLGPGYQRLIKEWLMGSVTESQEDYKALQKERVKKIMDKTAGVENGITLYFNLSNNELEIAIDTD